MTDTQKKLMEMMGAKEEDFSPQKSPEERIAELEEQNAMLTECLLEISEIIYA